MNRISHIQKTLRVNIEQNKSASIQFVLLDYNSQDGLGRYIKENFEHEMNEERLIYYRYNNATTFSPCHSRNMAFQLATGDIVCNLDADNYAGPGFGRYVQNILGERNNVCLTGLENQWTHDASGRLCVSKRNFQQVTGYDENFNGYGFDDYDIVNRLQMHGCEVFSINKVEFLRIIPHQNYDRLSNHEFWKLVEKIFVHYIDPNKSKLLYLLQDGKFISGTIVNNYTIKSNKLQFLSEKRDPITPELAIEGGWEEGHWFIQSQKLYLTYKTFTEVCTACITGDQHSFQSSEHVYYEITQLEMKVEAVSFYTQSGNREIMFKNLANKNIWVNQGYGQGVVYKNFQDKPIEIK